MSKQRHISNNCVDKNPGKIIKRKSSFLKTKEEKCNKCGLIVKNKLLLKMHFNFEHEDDLKNED